MVEEISCHNGKCRPTKSSFLDECVDCNESEQIEFDLLKEQINE